MESMRTFAPQTRLFAEPNAAAAVIASIPRKTHLEVLETVGRHYKVYFADDDGQQRTGYVVADLLEPISEEKQPIPEEQPVLQEEGWWKTKGPKFDRTTGWLAAGLGLLLLTNLISSVVLWGKIRNLPPPSVHTTCSGSHALTTLMWEAQEDSRLIGVGAKAGEVAVAINFDLTQKTVGSEICVLYRPETREQWQPYASTRKSSEPWQQATCTLIDGLTYEAKLNLDYSQNWTYCIAEKHLGEIIRMAPARFLDLAWQSEQKYMYVQPLESEQPSQLKLRFWQLSTASKPHTGPITLDFFTKSDWETRRVPTFTAVASELVDLGEGRGVAYEISLERDGSWKYVRFNVALPNGLLRDSIYPMEELDRKQIKLSIDF